MGILGFGCALKRGDGGTPELYTTLAEIINISGPGFSLDAVEVTNTESPNKYKEFIPGLLESGEVSLDLNFLPSNTTQNEAAGIIGDMTNRTKRNFQIVWPDAAATIWSFSAYVTGAEPTAPIDDRMTMSLTLKITGEPRFSEVYGLEWNESSDSYTRIGDLLTTFPIQLAMKRCVLSDAGVVQYYLNATDSTLKADGSAADLTGGDGQVMVEIPKFWIRYGYAGTTHRWELSEYVRDGFSLHPAFMKNSVEVDYRYIGAYEAQVDVANTSTGKLFSISGVFPTTARNATGESPAGADFSVASVARRQDFRAYGTNRGTGWRQFDYDLASAVQLLYLVEYADFYSQSKIGMGRTELSGGTWVGDSYIGKTGKSNSDGNGTNSVAGNTNNAYMTYRGIENFFGNIWKFVDGININSNVPYVTNKDSDWADDISTNYTSLGVTLINSNGYQATLEQISRGFLPASVGATSSTKITDYYYQNTGWRVLTLGGGADYGSIAGVFYVSASDASSYASVAVGGRVCF